MLSPHFRRSPCSLKHSGVVCCLSLMVAASRKDKVFINNWCCRTGWQHGCLFLDSFCGEVVWPAHNFRQSKDAGVQPSTDLCPSRKSSACLVPGFPGTLDTHKVQMSCLSASLSLPSSLSQVFHTADGLATSSRPSRVSPSPLLATGFFTRETGCA